LEVVKREKFGVMPLRGKILNARDARQSAIAKNAELMNVVKALGLDFQKTYEKGIENQGEKLMN
jgi:DNA topoisomerase-2